MSRQLGWRDLNCKFFVFMGVICDEYSINKAVVILTGFKTDSLY